jgi:type II secretory ATPase GspE/PulE/Tfp pilus assembly ATPase PilB-like protein
LQPIGAYPSGAATDIVTRLKVLAQLLTYRTDVPQEGRASQAVAGADWRVSTFPTLHGERAVVRLVAASHAPQRLPELGLPASILRDVGRLLGETSGAILVTGPAGSGKTTTVYACLRELVHSAPTRRCVVTIEDPVETPLAGVVQSQVNGNAGFDLATGLRSILRQDPEVILVGEIRDRETAEGVFNAALTGHLVLTTFHAGSAAGAVSRLSEMGIEPYLLRSGLLAVLHQRLVRRLCGCARPTEDPAARLGIPVAAAHVPVGCERCQRTGYGGRMVLAELLLTQPTELGRAILSRDDASRLEQLARATGLVPIADQALAAVEAGLTSPLEVRRVLGGAIGAAPTRE